jgi:hypothetical protein
MMPAIQKRPYIVRHVIYAPVLLLALVFIAGCHSNGYRKGDAAARSMQMAAAQVHAESRAIDVTMETLNDLVNKPGPDLKPQFLRFQGALNRLEEAAARTERSRAQAEARNKAYFNSWGHEVDDIQFGAVRDQSENRRAAVTNRFHNVNVRYVEAQAVVQPLISYFNDIRSALSVDLTTAGLDSVRGIVSNAEQNARKVRIALGELAEELSDSSAALSSHSGTARPVQADAARVRSNEAVQ